MVSGMELRVAAKTDVGRERKNNEDMFHVDLDQGLFLVSDGMGGQKAGEVASATAVETFSRIVTQETELLTRARRGDAKLLDVVALTKRALEAACLDVFRLANSTQSRDGMGCTLTGLLVVGSRAIVAHVGDSRLYLMRGGRAEQLTHDHALAAELVRNGSLTPEQAKTSPYRNVLSRGVGLQASVEVDTLVLDVQPGDRYVICSDGFSEYIEDAAWLTANATGRDLDQLCETMVAHANESGGRDNITVVVVDVAGETADEVMVERDGELLAVSMLDQCYLFRGLSFAELTRVLAYCRIRILAPQELLIAEGDMMERVYLVLDGHLVAHGRNAALRLGAGDTLGATSVMRPRQAVGSVVAEEETRVLSLSRDALRNITRKRGRIGAQLTIRLARELALNTERAHEALRQAGADPRVVAEIV